MSEVILRRKVIVKATAAAGIWGKKEGVHRTGHRRRQRRRTECSKKSKRGSCLASICCKKKNPSQLTFMGFDRQWVVSTHCSLASRSVLLLYPPFWRFRPIFSNTSSPGAWSSTWSSISSLLVRCRVLGYWQDLNKEILLAHSLASECW